MGNESGTWVIYGVEWVPVFANYRRDGYDFDTLYEDGKAPLKHKKIMSHFMDDKLDSEILSNQLKVMAGMLQKIVDHMHEIYSIATDKQIKKVLK